MSDDFARGERVVCISDRTPCCGEKIEPFTPGVGEIYKVRDIGMVNSDCGQDILLFVPEDVPGEPVWPQACFKRLPPVTITKFKKAKAPDLEKA